MERVGQANSGKLPPGTQLGRYEIISHLATGGMAEIYLANASGIAGFERLVVVKRIIPHLTENADFVEMFLDEARLAATLQHPHIAQVFDIGEHEGSYFFTMEFVHGQDTRTLYKKTKREGERIPIGHVIEIIMQASGALHYAHSQKDALGIALGIVHRDVSPANILLSYDGAVKVVDFGVAKASGRQRETTTGTLKGKLSYMSPEQIAAEPLDQRSDVYALGILLYEFATGTRLFDGESDMVVFNKIAQGLIPPPSGIRRDITPELEAIMMKALAQDRNDRYATAKYLQIALEKYAHSAQIMSSQRALGEYMHEEFASDITAWEEAQAAGRTLSSHLLSSSVFQLPSSDPVGAAPEEVEDADSKQTIASNVSALRAQTEDPQPAPPRAQTLEEVLAAFPDAPTPLGKRLLRWTMVVMAIGGIAAATVFFVMPKLGIGSADKSEAKAAAAANAAAIEDMKAAAAAHAAQLEAAQLEATLRREEIEQLKEKAKADNDKRELRRLAAEEKALAEKQALIAEEAEAAKSQAITENNKKPALTTPKKGSASQKAKAAAKAKAETKAKAEAEAKAKADAQAKAKAKADAKAKAAAAKRRAEKKKKRNSNSIFLPSKRK